MIRMLPVVRGSVRHLRAMLPLRKGGGEESRCLLARHSTAVVQRSTRSPVHNRRRNSVSPSAMSRSPAIRATSRSWPTGGSSSRAASVPSPAHRSGIEDAQAAARVLKIDFALERISVKSPAEVAPRWCRRATPAASISSSSMRRRRRSSPWPMPIRGRDILLFNATAADDALRRNLCAAEIVHTLPSLAMGMDALVQYLASRKWNNLLVFEGPQPADAVMVKAFENSAKKFGARIVARQAVQARHRSARAREERPGAADRHQPRLRRGVRRRPCLRFRPAGAVPHRAGAAGGRQHRPRAAWPGTGPGSATARRR